jgi:hypothetical protein
VLTVSPQLAETGWARMRKNNQDRGTAHQSLGIGTVENEVTHLPERKLILRLIAHNLIYDRAPVRRYLSLRL